MPHGDVHQRNQKCKGNDQPSLLRGHPIRPWRPYRPRRCSPLFMGFAPYPAVDTAASMVSGLTAWGSDSTCMLLVSRLTETVSTPSRRPTTFSTRAEQAEQVIPVTFIIFFHGQTSSQVKAGCRMPRRQTRQKWYTLRVSYLFHCVKCKSGHIRQKGRSDCQFGIL